MATIYRYILETREGGGTSGRKNGLSGSAKKGAGKKGSYSFFGGDKGGVEHNRKMRAINPLLNRATGGYWEKGMRLGRATLGLSKSIQEKGIKGAITGPALFIIIALLITSILKIQKKQMVEANKQNTQNYKQMEIGISAIHGEYSITRNYWNGKLSYNENK